MICLSSHHPKCFNLNQYRDIQLNENKHILTKKRSNKMCFWLLISLILYVNIISDAIHVNINLYKFYVLKLTSITWITIHQDLYVKFGCSLDKVKWRPYIVWIILNRKGNVERGTFYLITIKYAIKLQQCGHYHWCMIPYFLN